MMKNSYIPNSNSRTNSIMMLKKFNSTMELLIKIPLLNLLNNPLLCKTIFLKDSLQIISIPMQQALMLKIFHPHIYGASNIRTNNSNININNRVNFNKALVYLSKMDLHLI